MGSDAVTASGTPGLSGDAEGGLLVVDGLVKIFHHRRSREPVRAVDGVSFRLRRGGALGLVGESGSGKTTVGRCALGLIPADGGRVHLDGMSLGELSRLQRRTIRRSAQMVFQNPYDSLSPRWRVKSILEEPLILNTDMGEADRKRRVEELLHLVRLDSRFLQRFPHQLSGGQQQRIGIARAIATSPELVVLDEPTSALDMITRSEILELLTSLRRELQLTYLFISHDLSAIRRICDTVAVMYLGRILEEAPTDRLFTKPQHPYTRALLSAVLAPVVGRPIARVRLQGEPSSAANLPAGCRLHPRCPIAIGDCARVDQVLENIGPDHRIACMRIHQGHTVNWPQGWRFAGEGVMKADRLLK